MIKEKLRGRRDREPLSDKERIAKELAEKEKALENWVPKTKLGRMVKAGKYTSLEQVFDAGEKILEPEVVDSLAEMEEELDIIDCIASIKNCCFIVKLF